MSERRASAGRKRQVASSDFVEVTSEVADPLLSPGGSSKHGLRFKFLTTLELELDFTVDCPNNDVLGYPEDSTWSGAPWKGGELVGGLNPELRIAEFSKDVQVNPAFSSTGRSKNQRLSLKARARYGPGEWEVGVKLDHPIVITD